MSQTTPQTVPINQAWQLLAQGNHQDAAAAFEHAAQARQEHPDGRDALLGLARAYSGLGQHQRAGNIYVYLDQRQRALDAFKRAGAGQQASMLEATVQADASVSAQLYRRQGLNAHAAAAQADNADSPFAARLLVNDHQRLVAHFDSRRYPRLHAVAQVLLGQSMFRAGLEVAARVILQKVQAQMRARSATYQEKGQLDEAVFALRLAVIASTLLKDKAAVTKGYIQLARMHREQGKLYAALRFRQTVAELALRQGDLQGVIDAHHHTLNNFPLPYDHVGSTIRWRLAEAYTQAARAATGKAQAAPLWSHAARCYKDLGDAAMTARCYREIAALQLNRATTDTFWERAAKAHTEVTGPPAPRGVAPKAAWLTDWLDFAVTLLRLEELRGDLGKMLRELVWNVALGDHIRRAALHILLRLTGRAPREEDLLDAVKLVPALNVEHGLVMLDTLLESSSERVHTAIMEQAPMMHAPLAQKALQSGLEDKRMGVRCEAIDAVAALDYPEALAGLRELYVSCGCVGGRTAVLDAMITCDAPVEVVQEVVQALPHDPAMEAARAEAVAQLHAR